LVWFASLPYTETPYVPGCDTCSGTSFYDGFQIGQMDNDIYYQESLDQGASWQPRVNVTQCVIGAAGDKAYCDASVLYDSDDNLHVVWNAIPWPADFCMDDTGKCWSDDWSIKNARLMHWSENVPYIREVAEQVYDVDPAYEWIDSCRAGSWNANISKPSLSECDGRLYVLWTQFNNPREGIVDDCAQWALDEPQGEGRNGGANGELWVSVSEDWGMNWDYQRNLTNSYTPGCDPTWEDDCESDHWPSMSRTGRQVQTGTYPEDWSGAVEVDPSGGSYTGDYYLDILYVNDADAGGVVVGEGGWTNNPIKWFRMPCVEPVGAPSFTVNWTNLDEPASVFPGEYLDTTLIIKNIGNTALTYSVEIVYDSGATGWLDASGFTGSIPSGLANTEVGYLRLNYQMWTDTSDGYAHLHFTGNDPNNLPADIYVKLVMADTILVVFAPSVDYSVGMYPSSVHSADLDGDDDIDLAVTNTESDDVSILLNNGDGTFATAVNYAVNDQPVSVCGADFDDDDDQDLAVANAGSDNVSVLTNNGDGTFDDLLKTGWTTTLGVADYGVGSGPRSVFTCDLDGDDDDDLATANSESDNVSVLTNNGDGTYSGADNYPVGDCPVSVHGNDLDDDEDNDLAVANYSSNTVSVLKNNGDATFEGVVDYGVGSGPRSVLTCDLDGDGDCDIVTANEGSDDISVLLNYSDATFADAVSYPVGDSAMSVDAGDIDGDGDLDLIVANFGSDSVSVLINRGDATFEGVVDYGVGSGPRAVHLADLDGDNVCDIATANSLADSVTVLINLGEEPDDDCLLRGDFNRSGQFDILDIDDFIDYLFRDGLPPVSLEEIDVDDNGQIDILDIDYMVDYLFRGGPEPVPCP
ncbi:MAG: VCBS repeat-containing protein, partial [Candidatus Zixiibacteriota bacterium]